MRTVVYRGLDKPYGIPYICTSDAADGTIAPLEIPGLTGELQAMDIAFGTAAPDSLIVSAKTALGNEFFNTGTLTASKYVPAPDGPVGFAGGLTLYFTVVGNSKTFILSNIVF